MSWWILLGAASGLGTLMAVALARAAGDNHLPGGSLRMFEDEEDIWDE